MKFRVTIPAGVTPHTAINRCGYATHRDRFSREQSYVRRLGKYFYPRFHLYVQRIDGPEMTLSLHLDMKQPTYIRGHAHSGEYDGEQVEEEARRIQAAISPS